MLAHVLKGCFYSCSDHSKQATSSSVPMEPFYFKYHNDQKVNALPVESGLDTITTLQATRAFF